MLESSRMEISGTTAVLERALVTTCSRRRVMWATKVHNSNYDLTELNK